MTTPHEVIVQVLGNTFGTGDEYAADILDALGSAGYVIVSFESLPPTEQVMPSLPERMRSAAETLTEVNDRNHYETIRAYGRRDLLKLADRFEREDAEKADLKNRVEELAKWLSVNVGTWPEDEWPLRPKPNYYTDKARLLLDRFPHIAEGWPKPCGKGPCCLKDGHAGKCST